MSESAVLLVAILVVCLAVLLSVALSLAKVAAPGEGALSAGRTLPARVLCPVSGQLARVEIGFEPPQGELGVVSCETFPTGVFECERECFPTLILTPLLTTQAA